MFETKERFEYASLISPPIKLRPTAATQQYYDSIGHPEWGIPDTVGGFSGYPQNFRELIRSEVHGHKKWNSCEHYKCWFEPTDTNEAVFEWPAPTYETPSRWWTGVSQTKYLTNIVADYMNFSVGSMVLFQPREDGGFVPPPPGLSTMQLNSLKAMMPQVKANLSLINSIIELRDFRSLPRTLTKMKDTLSKVGNLFLQIPRSFSKYRSIRNSFSNESGSTLREVLKSTADGYLQSQFNLLPLLSDVQGIYSSLVRTEKVVRNLINRQGRLQRRHYTFRWFPESMEAPLEETVYIPNSTNHVTPGLEVIYDGPNLNMTMLSYTPKVAATFHAEIEYNYHFTRFQVEHAQLLGMLDSLGVNLNPSIIWNALPWSFVVDWVFGVSRWLDSRKVLNLEPVVNISRYLWSWSYSRRSNRRIYGDNLRTGGFGPQKLPTVFESVYRRDVGLPDVNSLILSGLSPKEISLGVALAITRKKRPRTRGR